MCDTDVKMKLGSTSQVDFFYKRIIKADGDYVDWSTVQVFPLLTDRPLTTSLLLHYFVYRGPAGFCLHAKPPWVIFLQELLCRILLHCFGRLFTFSLVYHGFSWYRFYSLFYLAILFQVLMMIVIISFVVLILIFFFLFVEHALCHVVPQWLNGLNIVSSHYQFSHSHILGSSSHLVLLACWISYVRWKDLKKKYAKQ